MPADLPAVLTDFAASLGDAGFQVVADESGGMDCRALSFRRGDVVIRALKERGVWSLDIAVDGWAEGLVFPVVHGTLRRNEHDPEGYDPFPPRRDRAEIAIRPPGTTFRPRCAGSFAFS